MDKIFITGAAGFIGSNLAELCIKKGYKVKAFDRYNSMNDYGWLEDSEFKDDFEIILGDIRDLDSVKKAMSGCDVVFHLAALIGIPYSYVSPIAYIRTNVEGTYNVLEAAKELNINETLITSTSEVYGSAQYVPMDENHPVVGQSPYSASKIGADQMAISYFKSFGLPVKIIRPFNTYGPRQSARAVIPTIILQLLNGSLEIQMGSLEPKRDFTFVMDTASAYLAIYKSDKLIGEVTNVGSNREISIGDLVELIALLMNVETNIGRENKRVRPVDSEVNRLLCDNSKLLKSTTWQPKYDLNQGLTETIEWLRTNQDRFKSNLYNI